MDRLLLLFIVAGALVALLANIAVWAPRKLRLKVTALITTALFLPTAYVTLSDLMSRPKPVAIEWLERTLPEATVLSAQLREDVAIYLWLAMEGVEEPRAYALPWSEPLARQLFAAQHEAEQQGTELRMRRPFETSLDDQEQMFYAAPQAMPPDKPAPGEAPLLFKPSRKADSQKS